MQNEQWPLIFNLMQAAAACILTYTGLPIYPAVVLFFIMMADVFTGCVRAYSHGEALSTDRLKRGIIVKIAILIIPAVVASAVSVIHALAPQVGDLSDVVVWLVIVIILGETESCVQNTVSAATRKPKVEWSYMLLIGRFFRVVFDRVFKR